MCVLLAAPALAQPTSAAATSSSAALARALPAGKQVTLHSGGTASVAAIEARAVDSLQSTEPIPIPLRQQDRGSLPQDPKSAGLVATTDSRSPSPKTPQTPGTPFTGATIADAPYLPPDSMGTVGPTQYVVMINGRIRSFNKSTHVADGVFDQTTDTFWSSVRNNSGTSDPRIRYDRLSGRWFFTMVNVSMPTNRVLLAYSDVASTLTLSTPIHFFFYDVSGAHPNCFWDYDTLGIDANALYVGGNLFCPTSFAFTAGLVISKSTLLAGTLTATDFTMSSASGGCTTPGMAGDGPYTPQGVDNYDPTATLGYFAGTSICFYGELEIVQITNPGGGTPSASLKLLVVPATMNSKPVPAKNSTLSLDALDDRLFAAHLRNGHLWTAHNICVDSSGVAPVAASSCPASNRVGSRWYDVTNLGATLSLVQSGTVFDNAATTPRNYWIPSMMVSGQGHVALGSSAAGTTEWAEAATVGRLAGDPLGTMQTPVIYQASTSDYNREIAPKTRQRWGDYSYTSLDPSDDMTMWTIQEFTSSTNNWGVSVVQLKAPPPANPTSVSGGPFYADRSSQTVSVTGTAASGSGFFDPGPGFTGRLQAAVSGGVTVNSVTYVDPTHITLNISTVGAAAGLKNLTVTNPDGQLVTANNLINIQAPPLPTTQSAVSTSQYSLGNSNGTTWQEIDAVKLRISNTPGSNLSTVLTANADLFTANSGVNQDLGIFVSDNGGADTLLAWKESGGSAGVYSPNAAYVQHLFVMTAGHPYVFKLKWKTNVNAPGSTIYAGAGPLTGAYSPTSLIAKTYPSGSAPNFAASTSQYTLANSNGTSWQNIDAVNLATTLAPSVNSTAVLGGNADLFTANSGFNQDLGIFVSDNGGGDTLVAWKESGGSAGVYSPNAAFVKGTLPMIGGRTYAFKLKWKTNVNAPGTIIYAAAGPSGGPNSPTSLLAESIPSGGNPYVAASIAQYTLNNSDGATWQLMSAALKVTASPSASSNSILGANADLFTGNGGFNQDIGIFVSDNGGADALLAWKESGGSAGVYSPNAAFAQISYPMTNGHTYVFKLMWKTNTNAPGTTIYAGAGPGAGPNSPTRLTVEITN